MTEEQHDLERPAKRIKLETGPQGSITLIGTPGYILLAKNSYEVNICDTDVYKSLLKPNCNGIVELTKIDTQAQHKSIWIRVPWLKTVTELATPIGTTKCAAHDLAKHYLSLPSSIKRGKKDSDRPLCKYEARLSVQGQRSLLDVHLLWLDTAYSFEKIDHQCHLLLSQYSRPDAHSSLHVDHTSDHSPIPWSVKEFYENVHVPPPDRQETLKLDMVQCKLYPFQDRATQWMLSREGVNVMPSGQLVKAPSDSDDLPLDFRKSTDALDRAIYVSSALNVATTSLSTVLEHYQSIKGGILAEAMGLGKTVEMIALMCSHTRNNSPLQKTNIDGLRETGATLIITPVPILEQWMQELSEHAPGLQIYHYTGMRAKTRREDLIDMLARQDVVLTTYNVIASEIHYVNEKPDRNLRDRPRRELPKSPLTQISWWRCLLDEAQMVESGVSNAAIVARLIPRVNAWAVTGTPLKQSHRDLYGLLLFLRYEPWCQSVRKWDYLVLYHRDLLRKLIGEITLRHSKELVRDELRIPPQSRRVASLPFTAIEESHYTQLHHDMQQECGFDDKGAPIDEEWDPNSSATIEKMRSWLQRLRQTCLHPEVGGRNRRALGRRGGPLRTVAQVLDVMIEQTESIVHTEQRNLFMSKVDQARLLEHARQSQVAQNAFREAYAEVLTVVADARKELEKEIIVAASKGIRNSSTNNDTEEEEEEVNAALLTARQRLRSALEIQHICIFFIGNTHYQLKADQEALLSKEESHPIETAKDQAHKEGSAVSASVEATKVLGEEGDQQEKDRENHIKSEVARLEELEAKAYEEAKSIRTELLMEVQTKAQKRIDSIHVRKSTNGFVAIPSLDYSVDDFGGIESRKVFEKLYNYCKAMNVQAEQFQDVRGKMVDMLDRTLIDKEDNIELTGDEYEDSTKLQDEMYVLMEMLRALFADRSDAISGQENLLLKQETKTFLRQAKENEGPSPELMIRLLTEREAKRIVPGRDGSLRGIMTEIRSLATSLEWQESTSGRARAELSIVNKLLDFVQKTLATQSKAITALEQEVNFFRDAMNARLEFYRALQRISDMVAPIGEEDHVGRPIDTAWLSRLRVAQEAASKKLSVALSKRRYLLHLKNESETDGTARICTICQFEFENGTLTVCGHAFCAECIQLWWSEHRNCPVCKRRLQLSDFHDITYKPQASKEETDAVEEESEGASHDSRLTKSNPIYDSIPTYTMNQIRAIDVRGSSYGSKVDILIRHVLYLRTRDPGSKCIIFSQYRDFLDVLSRSLRDNSIIHSKFDSKDGIIDFKSNPANECFLLHAKAHAAGLNLVCASHVILCEPLINTAIELQAVARVHRIGQQRPTTVWMYLIEGTVEEAIYDISVKRRLAHMDHKSRDASRAVSRATSPSPGRSERNEAFIDAANSKELQAADLSKMFAKGNTSGEMVDQEDLWGCLFGNAEEKQRAKAGVKRGLADLEAGATPGFHDTGEVGKEIGRFLRAEAAEERGQGIGVCIR